MVHVVIIVILRVTHLFTRVHITHSVAGVYKSISESPIRRVPIEEFPPAGNLKSDFLLFADTGPLADLEVPYATDAFL